MQQVLALLTMHSYLLRQAGYIMAGKCREDHSMERQPVGIRFLLPNMSWKPIQALLSAIDFRSYYWEIRNDEICGWRDISGVYQGAEVMQALPLTEYYCISMILKGFADDRVEHIPNYAAMCKSSCEILFMIDDVEECTIITKISSYCQNIWEELTARGYQDLRPLFVEELPSRWNYM